MKGISWEWVKDCGIADPRRVNFAGVFVIREERTIAFRYLGAGSPGPSIRKRFAPKGRRIVSVRP